ncbi:hypothetical protein F511_44345 [Dorcoceras hygrometricum]|uniref:Uncharacterized protein n=1 Tax=Dorcoceras hygrometricum TaxID=472368 RepID=A0A2Z6ZXZ5_9LAMI|nr:hypothetical protein F511_44345 [Dorcoceras hygrometricum]
MVMSKAVTSCSNSYLQFLNKTSTAPIYLYRFHKRYGRPTASKFQNTEICFKALTTRTGLKTTRKAHPKVQASRRNALHIFLQKLRMLAVPRFRVQHHQDCQKQRLDAMGIGDRKYVSNNTSINNLPNPTSADHQFSRQDQQIQRVMPTSLYRCQHQQAATVSLTSVDFTKFVATEFSKD